MGTRSIDFNWKWRDHHYEGGTEKGESWFSFCFPSNGRVSDKRKTSQCSEFLNSDYFIFNKQRRCQIEKFETAENIDQIRFAWSWSIVSTKDSCSNYFFVFVDERIKICLVNQWGSLKRICLLFSNSYLIFIRNHFVSTFSRKSALSTMKRSYVAQRVAKKARRATMMRRSLDWLTIFVISPLMVFLFDVIQYFSVRFAKPDEKKDFSLKPFSFR